MGTNETMLSLRLLLLSYFYLRPAYFQFFLSSRKIKQIQRKIDVDTINKSNRILIYMLIGAFSVISRYIETSPIHVKKIAL